MSDRRSGGDALIREALEVAQEFVNGFGKNVNAREIAAMIGRAGLGTRRQTARTAVIAAVAAEWMALRGRHK